MLSNSGKLSVKVKWRCLDCGLTGTVTARDVWQAIGQSGFQHEKRAGMTCPADRARIFPRDMQLK
jgi:hypothetical protein